MKQILALGALVAIALTAMSGCSDDSVSGTDINQFFEPKKGDTFTYARYERDMNNQRVDSTKTIHKWIVLETKINYKSRNDVAKILQLNFDMTGTIKTGDDDILYISAPATGEVYMDVISSTIRRIPNVNVFADSIPFDWFQISDTKSSNAVVFASLTGSGITKDVVYPSPAGNLDLRLNVTGSGYHKGKVPTSVGSTLYPNAFHTDHAVKIKAILWRLTGAAVIDDSLHISYDVDTQEGILRQVMQSDTITANLPIIGRQDQPVNGFEMELIGAVHAP